MENENKCFFSISLENGITITGNNPIEVRKILYEMHSAFFHLSEYRNEIKCYKTAKEAEKIMHLISYAIDTITNNLKHNNNEK